MARRGSRWSTWRASRSPSTAATRSCTLSERLRLFRAVCEAVQHAHRHAVIHRDLKPSNILVKADGAVKLLDFGIAKQLDPTGPGTDPTRTGLRLMTPAYAAPEQVEGGRLGVQTDVYALGVLLFELLAGRLPFELTGLQPHEAARRVLEQEPPRPSQVPGRPVQASRAAWADLDVLCLTAMQRDPARRYPSVEALIRDLDHHLAGEPLDARPDSLAYRAGKLLRRNARAVLVASGVGVAVLGVTAYSAVRLARARDAVATQAARTQRIQQFMLQLFEGGTGEVGPSSDVKVVDLVDRGVREAQSLEAEPAVEAELLQTLGGIAQNLGRLDQAETLLTRALELRRTALGPDHPDVGRSLVASGQLASARGRYDDAERQIREGLTMLRRRLSRNDPEVARADLGARSGPGERRPVPRGDPRARGGSPAPDWPSRPRGRPVGEPHRAGQLSLLHRAVRAGRRAEPAGPGRGPEALRAPASPRGG